MNPYSFPAIARLPISPLCYTLILWLMVAKLNTLTVGDFPGAIMGACIGFRVYQVAWFATVRPLDGRSFVGENTPMTVAILGLGAGGIASYANWGQSFTFFEIDPSDRRMGKLPSHCVILARTEEDLQGINHLEGWHKVEARPDLPTWTDHHSSILPYLIRP